MLMTTTISTVPPTKAHAHHHLCLHLGSFTVGIINCEIVKLFLRINGNFIVVLL